MAIVAACSELARPRIRRTWRRRAPGGPRRPRSASCRARRGRRTSRLRCPTSATSTARIRSPAFSAESVVWPTAATCGSVKITRGLSGPSAPCASASALAEDVVGGDPALVLAHVREQDAAVDVADRVEPVVARHPHVVVDLDVARPARSRARRARASPAAACARARSAPRRRARSSRRRRRPRRRRRSCGSRTPSTRSGCRRRSPPARRVTCAHANSSSRGQQPALALDQRHLRAERAVGLRHLAADHPAAGDHEPPGDALGRRRLPVGPRMLDPVEPGDRRHRRHRARGDDDGAARLELLVADAHAPLAGDPADTAM